MTDKSKQRRKALASEKNISHQAAANELHGRLRALVNASEREVERKLESAAAIHDAHVYAKVRFADIVDIESSGITNEEYRYALQCHLDFVVTNEARRPVFAVEFDGGGHDAKRDPLKNSLCERFHLPLARVDHRHLQIEARGLDALDWLTEVHFMFLAMEEAQATGAIPYDEPLDPLLIYSWGRSQRRFPLSFEMATNARIQQEHAAGRLPVPRCFQVAVQSASEGWSTAMITLRVRPDRFLAVRERIYLRGFGIGPSEAAVELAMARMDRLLTEHVRGIEVSRSARAVYEQLRPVVESGTPWSVCTTADLDDFQLVDTMQYGQPGRLIPPRCLVG